jgi:hypothetical protein
LTNLGHGSSTRLILMQIVRDEASIAKANSEGATFCTKGSHFAPNALNSDFARIRIASERSERSER